ncbi:FAD binding domain-containing protein [Thiorhodococcus minor]|uniref:2Fe-2S iron-sulfur cluster binding domain-containing protein n=1 Tax=Thiorhodococcus minor TaxID=57489 RepID=A0A6M0K502_9GAMM|nr:FAD binding domain-containing protein [Thiorhodococcus minor]NEV64848.1 2Fe-2S iron-sulfur cluster binding domain-containing protein [Thiorhodococcus minor]
MIHCLLNDEEVCTEAGQTDLTLTWLREQRGLTGTKYGCGDGGCGACAVLLGHRDPRGAIRYRVVDSCLLPLGALREAHLVTIEGLSQTCAGEQDALGPIQAALVEEGAVQCGFCTPGLVVALTAYLLNGRLDCDEEVLEAVDGNLCRCTGYMGIKRAVRRIRRELVGLPNEPVARRDALIAQRVLPPWFAGAAQRLAALPASAPRPEHACIIAGGTDLFGRPDPGLERHPIWLLERDASLSGVTLEQGRCRIGAGTTIEELLESDALASALPHVQGFLSQVSATPIRDRATLGGNLVNASPIADLCICLLALDAEVTLAGPSGERALPLADLYLGYKRLAMAEDEMITAVAFPLQPGLIRFNFEKVAHRKTLDIAAVNSAMRLDLEGSTIQRAILSAGGVGPTPRRLSATSDWLTGRLVDAETVGEAARLAMAEATPIDDVHGSATYKRTLLGRLVQAHFLALAPNADELRIDGDTP